MATYGRSASHPPRVFISFRGSELRDRFVSYLHMALLRDGVDAFIDTDLALGSSILKNFEMIGESRIALVILSSGYTDSRWCLKELVKIKELAEEGKLLAVPIYYKLKSSEVRRLEGDFGLNLWNQAKRTSKFQKFQAWKEAVDFIAQKKGLESNMYRDEYTLAKEIARHVQNCLSLEKIEDSRFQPREKLKDAFVDTTFSRSEELKSVEGETVEIFWDAKSDLDPEEPEIVHSEATTFYDNLNLRKDDNFLGDATSDTQTSTENKTVDQVNEEKEQGKVGKSSIMVTYDEHPPQHQVFINFRGAELRNNFVSKLLMALETDGINVFIEDDEKMGLDIKSHLKRIDESRIALVIFSSRYAESKWCLNELVKIKERRDEGKLLVIPIFYKVKPSEVEHLKEDFGVKFWNSWRINRDSHIIKWKEALISVTSIKGISLNEHSSESEFISRIVNIVREKISLLEGENPSVFPYADKGKSAGLPTGKGENHESYLNKDHFFGMEERMEQLEMKLKFDCKETRIVGVVGLPGIGKTTLARMLYEKWNCKFIRCVPLLDIRKKSEDYGPVWLQKTILEVLLEGKFPVTSVETAHESVKAELLKTKFFAVLDDVSDKKQLEFLLADLYWIKKGSKIVITTCDKSLLEGFSHDSYVVPLLNDNDSFQLFSYNAFGGQIYDSTGKFEALSKRFVDYAKGHPLALKILGRELCGRDKTYWKYKLHRMTESPSMIQDVWRISTDQLNVHQKDVFLDLVFFLKSEDEYFVRSLLDSGDSDSPSAVSEVRDLANKCLITILDGRVEMHDLLYTFGKEFGSQERHWLWKYKDIIPKLTKKSDANNVRGLFLDMSKLKENIAMERTAFTNMLNLRYLKIYDSCCRQCKADYNLHFHDGLEFPLREVRYLHWLKFPLNELPPDFRPENLVDLRLPYSKIVHVWEGVKDTPRLKWADLSHSSKLLDVSALSNSGNLQRLNLEGCTSLGELPVEIQNMKSLVFLNLRGCIRLSYLPEISLVSLKTLILSGCANLKEFKLISENLVVLHLDGTAIKGLPPSIKKLQRLVLLNLKDCRMLNCLPTCLRELKALEELILSGCSSLTNLSDVRESMKHLQVLLIDRIGAKEMPDISCVAEYQPFTDVVVEPIGPRQWPLGVTRGSSLQRLSLSGNDFVTLQTDIGQLYNLKWLDLKECKNLIFIPMLPPRLQYFDAHGCDSLERVANPLAFPVMPEQIHATFNFSNCNKLDEEAKDLIKSYTRQRSQLVLAELTQCGGGFVLEALIGTCFPGWEVPMWFSHQASGSVLEPMLPPHWCGNQFIGVALSAVVQFPGYHEQMNRLLVKCNCVFNNKDGSCIRFSCTIGRWSLPSNTPGKIEPSHVFIGYTSMLDIRKYCEEDEEGCNRTQALLEFQVTDGAEVLEGCEVLKCGFDLVYALDERENISWDANTIVIQEEIENSPGEVRSYGNSGSHDDIHESYSSLSLGRGETFSSDATFDATQNLQKNCENKRVDLLTKESGAGGGITSSSYHDNTSSAHVEKIKMDSLVGVELRLEQMEKVLYSTPGETRIFGVVGMPGIGKTTLATILYEKHGCKFPSHLFLTVSEESSLEQLRRLFLKELLKHVNQDINDDTTHESLEDKLRQTEVFVVLDGVSSKKQLEFLLGNLNWVKKGSNVVITTCKKSLIERLAHDIYVVPQLNNKEAFQLLTYHAFYNQVCPWETFVALSRMFVDNAMGNPLVLKTIGSVLYGKDEAYWRDELERVRGSFHLKRNEIWGFSIGNLTERQRDVFLDTVCFFESEDEHFVRRLLDSGNPEDVNEVRDVADKCLVTISGGRVKMHDRLYGLAKYLGSLWPTKLWKYKDVIDKLKKMKQSDANNVRSIFLDMSKIKESITMEYMTFTDMHNLLYLKIYDSCCPRQCKAECNLYFPDGLEFSLEELRYLHWVNFPLEELPLDFRPENLVDLRLPYSKIKRVWEGFKDTPRLKWVDLSYSSNFLDLSALSKAENLERLNLEGCTSLDELPVEIVNMKSLVFMNLRGCICLRSLPKMNLVSLKTLILSDCSNLREFQLISESVEFLHLDGTAIKRLPPGIQNLQRLVLLNLKNCKMLECLPNCMSELKVLDELILSGCSRLKNLPEVRHSLKHLQILLFDGAGAKEMPSISCFAGSKGPTSADMFLQWSCEVKELYSIRRLCLNGNDFVTLQPDIGKLYNLKWLDIKDCKKLRFVPALPPRLQYFDAHGCHSLEKVANPLAFPVMSEQIHATFNFSNCNKLDQDAKNHIMSYARQKSEIVLDKLTRCNGSLVLEALIGTCFPGWEVPAWFSHRASGSVLTPNLLPHWCDNRFTGIGLCAVIVFPNYDYQRKHVVVKCNGELKNEDESIIRFSCTIGGWRGPSNTPRKIESSHVYIGFISRLDINVVGKEDNEEKCVCTETSVVFQVTDGTEEIKGCEVLKCGFSLLYAPEERGNICFDS